LIAVIFGGSGGFSLVKILAVLGSFRERMLMDDVVAGGSPSVLRHLNTRMLLRTVRESGGMSRAELITSTGLSRPTVNQVVTELLRGELLIEADEDTPTRVRRGPKPRMLRINAAQGALLGIDVGAHKSLILLSDLQGKIVATIRVETSEENEPDGLIGRVRAAIAELLDAHNVRPEHLHQAVISTPGIVDPGTGRLGLAPQLPALNGQDVGALLGLTCPTVVENEMHLAVLAEQWRGAARGAQDVVYVGVGVGVGAGVMINGQIHKGSTGAAGEIGYLDFGIGSSDIESSQGTFETLVGARALAAHGRELASKHEGRALLESANDPNAITAVDVFVSAQKGDAAALLLVDEFAATLARGISALVLILDPAIVVVGGGMSKAGPTLMDPLRLHLEALLPTRGPRIVASELGDEASALGALRMARGLNDDRIDFQLATGEGK
jgi:predicted NBD/HSP70 family sugar kinase